MTTIKVFQSMNSHRKHQGHAIDTLPESKDTGKGLPSEIHLITYLVWRVQVLNTIVGLFCSIKWKSDI